MKSNLIRQCGPISRAQISKKTKITRAAVSDIVSSLLLNYNSAPGYGVSIDLGGTNISMAVFNVNAELITHTKIPTFQVKTSNVFLALLADAIKRLITDNDLALDSLLVIGIGTPGIVDYQKGIVVEGSPNLPEWENLHLSDRLHEAFGVPVIVENDVRAALVGEIWKGQCQGARNAVLVTLSTGIGSALLLEGNIVRGSNNAAGEIGYMLFGRETLSQDWGYKGCFETFCSGSGMIDTFNRLHAGPSSPAVRSAEEIFRRAKRGDQEAVPFLDEMIDHLAIAVLNLIATVNPERVVLMGGVTNSADYFLDKLNDIIRRHTFSRTHVHIVVTELKELAPLYGMSILALHAIQPDLHFLQDIQLT